MNESKVNSVQQVWAIGTILHSSWGYDQTNCDFYEVVGYTPSNKSVRLRTLGNKVVAGSEGFMSCRAVADLDNKGEGIFTRRILDTHLDQPYVKIGYGQYAKLWDGKPQYWSWYA